MNNRLAKFYQRLYPLVLGGLFMSGFLTGCDPEESCVSFSTNEFDIAFVTLNEEEEEVPQTVNFDLVRVLASDTIYFTRNETGISALKLTLNPAADTTTFIFEEIIVDEEEEEIEIIDTLQVAYRRNYRMISPECGIEVKYSDLSVVYHTFEEARGLITELSETTKGPDVEIFK